MARKPSNYWEKRSTELMKRLEEGTENTINSLIDVYEQATKNIKKEINNIFRNFEKDSGLDKNTLIQLLNKRESEQYYKNLLQVINNNIKDESIRNKLLVKYNAPAYSYRISRYEALQQRIDVELKKLAGTEQEVTRERYVDTIKEAYYHNIYDIQKGTGLEFNFAQIDQRTIDLMLNENWTNNANFSKRVWSNNEKLGKYLKTNLTADTLSGKSIVKISKELAEYMNVGLYNATRLVRTETNYFANRAELLSMQECGIEKYVYMATLDKVTCKQCAKLDGKKFLIKDAKQGVNCPPLHSNDRCGIVSYFGEEELEGLTRIARDPVTGKNYYIDQNITYDEWKKQIDNKYGKGTVDLEHKKNTRSQTDKKQYERYKNALGKEKVPKTFANFQDLKYNDIGKYNDLKYTYNLKNHYNLAIEKGDLSSLVDFDTYKTIDKDVQNELIGLKTTNGIEIKSYSRHFVDRVCGSIEQKRSGVNLDEISKTIDESRTFKKSKRNNSIKIIGKNSIVSINPETGNLIQVNPR